MKLAKVIGTVVATKKSEKLQNLKILMIQPLDESMRPVGGAIAAVDVVQAGPGEVVYYTLPREAPFSLPDPNSPVDAAITGIVDQVNLEDKGIVGKKRIFVKNR
ncbi:MAG: EutN/CcmL family microcompartment protein [Acidobacteriota bacterium]|nr:EutN/CcmL family microcompartment protein [Acidobacteriota bacterium]